MSALPASVSPGPVSGEDGKRNGTPWPKMLARLHTGPMRAQPRLVQNVERLELRIDRFRALDVEDRGDLARRPSRRALAARAAHLERALRCRLDAEQQRCHAVVAA